MFIDESIRKASIEQIEAAIGKALEEVTGKRHDVSIKTISIEPGRRGTMELYFGRSWEDMEDPFA